jgi:hypothetical protein
LFRLSQIHANRKPIPLVIEAMRVGDARRNMPRFQGANLRRNLVLVGR